MDLWKELKTAADAGRHILCYGMGDGADKLFAVCERKGIPLSDTFASDGFVRGQLFHGKRVLSYSEAISRYDDPILLLAFGSSRPEVLDWIQTLDARHTIRIPDLPVTADRELTVFDDAFLAANEKELCKARARLLDERSKRLFDDMVEYRLTGKIEPLFRDTCPAEAQLSVFPALPHYRTCLDLGAYSGDTALAMLRHCPDLEAILAAEPDTASFRRLQKNAAAEGSGKIIPMNVAAWDHPDKLCFAAKGNRNSSLCGAGSGAKTVEITALPADEMAGARTIDFIKYDVEGAENAALRGSTELLRRDKPDLLLSLYHRVEDLFALPLLLHELAPDYRMLLRRAPGFPGWDLNLLATAGEFFLR